MSDKTVLRLGIIGTIIAALCSFTPVLVIALGAVGLTSLVPRLDPILIPVLLFFVALTFWAFSRRYRSKDG